MKRTFNPGAYPTMITPFNRDNTVDGGAVCALVDWYWENGCDGIFASCQSSEIHELSLSERVLLARLAKEESTRLAARDPERRPMTVVASGHVGDTPEAQKEELNAVADTGIDALILISNRMDIDGAGDDAWIRDCDRLLSVLPEEMPLGIYECPRPRKRLLTPAMLRWMAGTGRFAFIKDTCCSARTIAERIGLLSSARVPDGGCRPALFNANAQTLLSSLRSGAAGYCGIMCNFHPDLYVRLCRVFREKKEEAELIAAFLSTAAFLESLTYPCIAKYHLNRAGVPMTPLSRSCRVEGMTVYDTDCVDAMALLAEQIRKDIGL